MNNFVPIILLHLTGDFYFQTSKISKCKNAAFSNDCRSCSACKNKKYFNVKYVLLHSGIYTVPFSALFFVLDWKSVLLSLPAVFVTHSVVDFFSCYLNKKKKQTAVFVSDQLLHMVLLYLIFGWQTIPDTYNSYIRILLPIFLIGMPSCVFINKLFADLFEEATTNGMLDTGAVIGILERIMVLIFAYYNNFATIAIIITIKTWARTGDLKESREFRNKYLLGTLASLVMALLAFLVYKSWNI